MPTAYRGTPSTKTRASPQHTYTPHCATAPGPSPEAPAAAFASAHSADSSTFIPPRTIPTARTTWYVLTHASTPARAQSRQLASQARREILALQAFLT